MLIDLLIVALAAGFIVSFLDRWFEEPWAVFRGFLALLVSVGGFLTFDYSGVFEVAYLSLASSFLSLLMILAGERLATVAPMVLDSRRR